MLMFLLRLASATAADAHKNLPYRKRTGAITEKEEAAILTRFRTTFKRVAVLEEDLLTFEDQNLITSRWVRGSPEYEEGKRNIVVVIYRKALDTLQRLVVQRLLELTKLNVSGVGEYMPIQL
jgi:hypothetical protein